MSFRQRRKRVIWSHRGRGARRNARCFFLLIAPLHLPQAARCSEPVNSQCGCVWQGRRFGSASKVKQSRKTGVSLLFLAHHCINCPNTQRYISSSVSSLALSTDDFIFPCNYKKSCYNTIKEPPALFPISCGSRSDRELRHCTTTSLTAPHKVI